MSVVHGSKASLIKLITTLKVQTGVNYEQMRLRMSETLQYEITRDRFDLLFRRGSHHATAYYLCEIMALVQSLSRDTTGSPCTADQAISLFELTGMRFPADFGVLKQIFPSDDFLKAIERYKYRLDPEPVSNHPLQTMVTGFASLIREKTQGFVGRQSVFDRINRFIETRSRGYFLITGDPGSGKTALAAQYVQEHDCLHYFNIRAEGNAIPEAFLPDMCARLIIRYNLGHTELPPGVARNARFFVELLQQVSDRLAGRAKCVLVIDALDETGEAHLAQGGNPLYLPPRLPEGIFIVVTRRRPSPDYQLRIDCAFEELHLDADSIENRQDIEAYLQRQMESCSHLKAWVNRHFQHPATWFRQMLAVSEGNFMCLDYLLAAIEQGDAGVMSGERLAPGLVNYYEDHWKRMRLQSSDRWLDYKASLLVALSSSDEPATLAELEQATQFPERYILSLLHEWAAFIHEDVCFEYDACYGRQIPLPRYRLYHRTFLKFIQNRDHVITGRLNLARPAHRQPDLMDEAEQPELMPVP